MKLAVFTKNLTNPAYRGARLGADRAAQLFGAESLHFVPETPDDPAQQAALIDLALSQSPDAFILSPVHPARVNGGIQRIHAAGIPIFSLVSPIDAVPCVSHVGSDDYQLGIEIARYLFGHLNGKGTILVVSGQVDSATSLARLRGFADASADYPDITITDTIAGDYILPTARDRMAQWLTSHQHTPLDACLVANDTMALGVIDSLKTAHRTATVVGVNAIPEAIPAIQKGELLATADFNAMRMAYLAAECAVRHLNGESVPVQVQLPVQIVDSTNCHMWNLPYEQRDVLTLADVRQ